MQDFHSEKSEKIFEVLKTSALGLSSEKAAKRLQKYGENRLSEQKPPGAGTIFISQFKNSLIYILMVSGALSIFIGAIKEAIVIGGAIIINVFFGFFQENKANQALQKLRKLSEHKASVLRDGQEIQISSTLLVPGDIVVLRAGNRIPADARIFEAVSLTINESSLTGESVPAKKQIEAISIGASLADRDNMAYSGTIIINGSGKAIVTATGTATELGQIASLVREAHEERTPLQIRLEKYSQFLGIVFVLACFAIIGIGLLQGRGLVEMIEVGIAVGVASIPEGLTVAITFILALGMQNILKEKALTRKLVAAETLGSTTVICTDKTGTLTKGEMSVDHIVIGEKEFELSDPGSRQNSEEAKVVSLALQTALMCNDASIENPDDALHEWRLIGTSTEIALLRAATESGLRRDKILASEIQIAKVPFDSEKKFMLSLHRHNDGSFVLYEKGAPEIVLRKSTHFYHKGNVRILDELEKGKLVKNYEKMTAKGLRVIAVAIRRFGHRENVIDHNDPDWGKIDSGLSFIGFIAIKDPLRPEAKETITTALAAGIRPIIITGDHRLTAKAIAHELGLRAENDNIIVGEQLEKISDEELQEAVKKTTVFARVSPHHKLRIVKALQANGEVVAMTGDGINDSPAIKAADIGISLGTGTDIAKETADLVLLDNNFKTILSAIRQGRVIFRNIQKIITYLTSDSFSEIILIAGSILLGTPLAILPAQILWINIVNDSLPNFSLAFEKGDSKIMLKRPISRQEPLLSREMKYIIYFVGIIRDLVVFAVFYFIYLYWQGDSELIKTLQTIVFATLGVKSLMSIFSLRHLRTPIWQYSPFSNPVLLVSVATSFLLLYAAIEWQPLQNILSTTHLTAKEWAIPFLIGFIGIGLNELVKLRFCAKT